MPPVPQYRIRIGNDPKPYTAMIYADDPEIAICKAFARAPSRLSNAPAVAELRQPDGTWSPVMSRDERGLVTRLSSARAA